MTQIDRDTLQAARGPALDAYGVLEQSLLILFCRLLGTPLGPGGIVFFRLINSGLRNRTIEELIAREYGTQFDPFWYGTERPAVTGLMKIIKQVDQRRNEIVHWHPQYEHETKRYYLTPPNFWDGNKNRPRIYLADLYEFSAKARFAASLVGKFKWRIVHWKHDDTSDHARAWQGIFEQPVPYPPGPDHPLYGNWQEWLSPRPPSRG